MQSVALVADALLLACGDGGDVKRAAMYLHLYQCQPRCRGAGGRQRCLPGANRWGEADPPVRFSQCRKGARACLRG